MSELLRPAAEALVHLEVPVPSMDAPLPVVIASDYRLFAAYYLDRHLLGRGSQPAASPPPEGHEVGVLKTSGYRIHKFGQPDENTIHGHRLAKLGLAEGVAFEVLNSAWIAELRSPARYDVGARPESYDDARHIILPFHDSTLEFIASDFEVTTTSQTMDEVLSGFIDQL